jgi:hypothetical protein
MSGAGEIPWSSRPPADGCVKFIPIFRAPETGTVRAVVVCPDLIGCWVHWAPKTLPCLGDKDACPLCDARIPKRWVGYLGCWLPESDRLVLLEVTRDAALACPELDDGLLPDLIGWRVSLSRAAPTKSGRVVIQFEGQVDDLCSLPPPFDVKEVLRHVWAGTMRRVGRGKGE